MSDENKGYAVSPEAAETDPTSTPGVGHEPTLDISKCYVVIDGKKVSVLDLLKKIHRAS